MNTKQTNLNQRKLAERLGISPSLVTRYKASGMPVDSVRNADAWRQANLHPGRTNPKPAQHDWLGIIAQILGVNRIEILDDSPLNIESDL